MKSADWVQIPTDKFGTLAICALRYCQGRETYMPGLVRDIVRPFLPFLSDKDIGVIVQDCDFQRRCHLYGDDRIDKPDWEKWEQEVLEEQKRRQDIEREDEDDA